ncbi:hypothetical protein [Ornithinimicrobium cerasi]|uniref:Uncharacterized protein n=1 Tax=Ornithinimicrobium cerasi TaxID=2248773 RepID=A0A285VB48_9MICO|nr:hypothetical protein [Ornithinimicrobium cerasi]SOC51197.1 hypothetical protein SAMN05421879_10173 [Ornithinimicrobium cerasi]
MTVAVDLQNRPFAVEPLTGIQMPDGIFDSALPRLTMVGQFRNNDAATLNLRIHFESASHPQIAVNARTHTLTLPPGAVTMLSWDVDVSNAPAGAHYVSFGLEDDNGNVGRTIRKIFVSRTSMDPSDGAFVTEVPEGTLRVTVHDLYGPSSGPGCDAPTRKSYENLLDELADYLRDPRYGPDAWSSGPYLLHTVSMSLEPNPHYAGQLGDLPFSDPDWKTILAIIAVILIIAAVVVAVVAGIAIITVGTGGAGGAAIAVGWACCAGPASIAATALGIGGMVSGIAAALGDFPGPFRVGQENTVPNAGEITVGETVSVEFRYPEPIRPGAPYQVEAEWQYERQTLDAGGTHHTYAHAQVDSPQNQHLLSGYEIDAADVVRSYQDPRWVVRARFHDAEKKLLSGSDLFVQCYLIGPRGEEHRFHLLDDGIEPDEEPNDGWYAGEFVFVTPMSATGDNRIVAYVPQKRRDDTGIWRFFVVAQDVDSADPNMTPEEAASHLGGILLTGQAEITMTGGTCSFIPDGHINVI